MEENMGNGLLVNTKRTVISILLVLVVLFSALFIYSIVSQVDSELKCKGCNVVFVSFDALQAKHVHNLGYFRNITPTIDEMASKGYNFRQAISASSWTVPSSMTWFTGSYPSQHKVVNKFSEYSEEEKILSDLKKLSPDIVTLAEIIKQNGYVTGGFTGDAGVSGFFGYSQGFDVYVDSSEPFAGLEISSPRAVEWLKENKDERFFLFLHGYDFHGQYEPSEGFDYRFVDSDYDWDYNGSREQQEMLREEGLEKGYLNMSDDDVEFWRAIYDEKIERADAKFAKFLEEMENLDLMNNTIFVLTSDHGTEFYEHGRFDHGFSLYDELIHVPLIIVLPNSEGISIDVQVRALDVMPTILDLLEIDVENAIEVQMEGASLAPLIKGEDLKLDAFIETDYRHYTYKRAIRTYDGWKLIYSLETGQKELYNIREDPKELNNLISDESEIAYDLERKLIEHLEKLGQDVNKKWEIGCYPVYMTQCQ